MSNYTNTFTPSDSVKSCHSIPHLNSHLQQQSNDFGLHYNDFNNSYSKSLVILPAIILVLGLLAMIILNGALCLRLCGFCRCAPQDVFIDGEKEIIDAQRPCVSVKKLKIIFYAAALCAVISNQALFFGNQYMTESISTANDALNFLANTFQSLTDDAAALESDSSVLSADVNGAQQCPALTPAVLSQFNSNIATFDSNVNDFQNFVSPLPSYTDSAKTGLNEYVVDYKNDSIWVLYCLLMGVAACGLGALWTQSKALMQLGLIVGQLLLLTMIVLGAVEMVVVVSFHSLNSFLHIFPASEFDHSFVVDDILH